MNTTIEAVIKNGHIIPLESVELIEGAKVLVTLSEMNDREFWLSSSEASLDTIWNNDEDDVYAELLTK